MKKAISLILSVLMVFSLFAIAGAEETAASADFSVLCYNVAGLPDISFITGGDSRDVPGNQVTIGNFVTENRYDIFAAQEDFGYHDKLVSALPDYAYQTFHRGGVPFGDGTSTFTRTFPIYNEDHIVWNKLYGIADDGADQFSTKGITYTCIEIADGVYLDFYNIHADAYGDEGSVEARRDNFNQLKELINGRTVDRPVIVTGDFNAYLFNDTSNLREILVDGAGLKDAWVETKNNGDYDNCDEWLNTYGGGWTGKWGQWDSVERFMYKDGGGVSLTCTDFEYINVLNAKGQACSDHYAASANFSFTVSENTTGSGNVSVTRYNTIQEFLRRVYEFFKALILGISNFDKVREYFGW